MTWTSKVPCHQCGSTEWEAKTHGSWHCLNGHPMGDPRERIDKWDREHE